jgi:hypothetical protein
MRLRLGVLLAALVLLLQAAAADAGQDFKPPANDDCLACHSDPDAKRSNGTSIFVAAEPFGGSAHGKNACVGCHADLAKISEFPHADSLAKVKCASCHEKVGATFHDSIHFKAREKSGLVVAPACVDCHGTHDILPRKAAASRVEHSHVAATCGKCHEGIVHKFDAGVHAAALKKGSSQAPTCIDCHTAHSIQRADTEGWHLNVTRECGTCHTQVVESFTRTFHGKVTQLGYGRVAACADCHGAHDILPASNPASMVSKARLVETCGRCHKGANERFVRYDPHPNPRSYARSPVLWWINQFYTVLIAGCFTAFGLHSLLWFRRERIERKAKRS